MKIKELIDVLETMDPEGAVFVHLFKAGNVGESYQIDVVRDNHGHAQLDIYEDDEVRAQYSKIQ